jgi:hypothetical protein
MTDISRAQARADAAKARLLSRGEELKYRLSPQQLSADAVNAGRQVAREAARETGDFARQYQSTIIVVGVAALLFFSRHRLARLVPSRRRVQPPA